MASINDLPNPFVYGLLYGPDDHPDIPVRIVPQFAQRSEDVIVDSLRRALLRRIGNSATRFTYLEIGANHPIAGSSTFFFYANGHRGTLVEANPSLIPGLRQSRDGDTIVEAAVVPGHETTVDLFIASRSELSSMRSDIISTFDGAEVVDRVAVPAIHVNDVIAGMWDEEAITYLSIDVEGLDFEILEAVDFSMFPFDIIQVEASENLIAGNGRRIVAHLERLGYRFANETEVNLIFVIGDERNQQKRGERSSDEDLAGFGVVKYDTAYQSWDLFDTLIARRGVDSHSALRKLRSQYGDMVDRRIAVDDGTRLLPAMYEAAGLPAQMMEEEIRLEIDELIPIARNIERLSDGDLIISDTYFPHHVLVELMRKAGITKRVGLYSSNLDKYHGVVWSKLDSLPLVHHGDNEVSDIRNAEKHGISVEHVTNSSLTKWELALGGASSPVAKLLREIRLRNSASKYASWQQVHVESNIPMLLSAVEFVRRLDREPVFLGRDCQQLSRIFRERFGSGDYLPFSRRFARDLDSARRYLLERVRPDQVIIDLVSTGRTWSRLNVARDVHVMIESDNFAYAEGFERPARFSSEFRTSEIGAASFIWEVLNCADHGMAIGVGNSDPGWVRYAVHELPHDFVRSMHEIVENLIISLENYSFESVVSDPTRLFLAAHQHLLDVVDANPSVFDQIRIAENNNLAKIVEASEITA